MWGNPEGRASGFNDNTSITCYKPSGFPGFSIQYLVLLLSCKHVAVSSEVVRSPQFVFSLNIASTNGCARKI